MDYGDAQAMVTGLDLGYGRFRKMSWTLWFGDISWNQEEEEEEEMVSHKLIVCFAIAQDHWLLRLEVIVPQ